VGAIPTYARRAFPDALTARQLVRPDAAHDLGRRLFCPPAQDIGLARRERASGIIKPTYRI